MSDSDEKEDASQQASAILKKIREMARNTVKGETPKQVAALPKAAPRPKTAEKSASWSSVPHPEFDPEKPVRYPGTIRRILGIIAIITYVVSAFWWFPALVHLAIDKEPVPVSLPEKEAFQLTKGCDNYFDQQDGKVTENIVSGSANNVVVIGIQTGPGTEFAIQKKGLSFLCVNSASFWDTLKQSGVTATSVTNEGDNNCVGYIEETSKSPSDVLTIKHQGGHLRVCAFPSKG